MLSVIIPTLNEERFLPRLLASLKDQTYNDFEVIVADSNSQDRTVDIARESGASVIIGDHIINPAMARNLGARIAQGDTYLFLDADVLPCTSFIEDFMNAFTEKKLDGAMPGLEPIHNTVLNKIVSWSMNASFWTSQFLNPYASGFCILVSKTIFDKVGGFNEAIRLGEDTEFIRKVAKIGKYNVLLKPVIHISFRRHEHEGYAKVVIDHLTAIACQLSSKSTKSTDELIDYKFGHYKRDDGVQHDPLKFNARWFKKTFAHIPFLDEKKKKIVTEKEK